VMSNIPKMGQLPTPEKHLPKKNQRNPSQQKIKAAPGDCRATKEHHALAGAGGCATVARAQQGGPTALESLMGHGITS
jgi:hypothetical protein